MLRLFFVLLTLSLFLDLSLPFQHHLSVQRTCLLVRCNCQHARQGAWLHRSEGYGLHRRSSAWRASQRRYLDNWSSQTRRRWVLLDDATLIHKRRLERSVESSDRKADVPNLILGRRRVQSQLHKSSGETDQRYCKSRIREGRPGWKEDRD